MAGEARTKSLAELGLTAANGAMARIAGLSVDSRLAGTGHLFAALPGMRIHGGEFIGAALRRGATAVLTDREGARIARDELRASGAALVVAEDPRQVLAHAAALWFGAQPRIMAAVTGTNGKTSVVCFTRQIWEAMGLRAASLGTTGAEGAFAAPLRHTTPEPVELHHVLSCMSRAGVTRAAMEASSHGLEQRRMDGVRLTAAAFTNLTRDHMDYHGGFDAYFDAKAGLFSRVLPEDGTAVVNIDDPRGPDMVAIARGRGQRVLTVGCAPDSDLRLLGQRFDLTGQDLRLEWKGRARQIRLNLIGGFQALNALVAAGLAIGTGAGPEEALGALSELKTVRGRMQLAAARGNGASVFVDYAHTPDAMESALRALRPHVMGRLVAVLGAGGERDRGKRPLMGHAAAEHADAVFVTDDNPRGEDPASIRAMVMEGCPAAVEVGDRAEAILRGVDALGPGDALLIAGKGHETGQVVGDDVLPFDDTEQASVAVAALEGRTA